MILDTACGSKMFWFDKQHKDTIYGDIRKEQHTLCDGRLLKIKPDILFDFKELPFKNNTFEMVVFDPPHLIQAGKNSWMAKKYGILSPSWKDDMKNGFKECFRVLSKNGFLIFKWNETQVKVSEILVLAQQSPLFGHISGKRANTHWMCFKNA